MLNFRISINSLFLALVIWAPNVGYSVPLADLRVSVAIIPPDTGIETLENFPALEQVVGALKEGAKSHYSSGHSFLIMESRDAIRFFHREMGVLRREIVPLDRGKISNNIKDLSYPIQELLRLGSFHGKKTSNKKHKFWRYKKRFQISDEKDQTLLGKFLAINHYKHHENCRYNLINANCASYVNDAIDALGLGKLIKENSFADTPQEIIQTLNRVSDANPEVVSHEMNFEEYFSSLSSDYEQNNWDMNGKIIFLGGRLANELPRLQNWIKTSAIKSSLKLSGIEFNLGTGIAMGAFFDDNSENRINIRRSIQKFLFDQLQDLAPATATLSARESKKSIGEIVRMTSMAHEARKFLRYFSSRDFGYSRNTIDQYIIKMEKSDFENPTHAAWDSSNKPRIQDFFWYDRKLAKQLKSLRNLVQKTSDSPKIKTALLEIRKKMFEPYGVTHHVKSDPRVIFNYVLTAFLAISLDQEELGLLGKSSQLDYSDWKVNPEYLAHLLPYLSGYFMEYGFDKILNLAYAYNKNIFNYFQIDSKKLKTVFLDQMNLDGIQKENGTKLVIDLTFLHKGGTAFSTPNIYYPTYGRHVPIQFGRKNNTEKSIYVSEKLISSYGEYLFLPESLSNLLRCLSKAKCREENRYFFALQKRLLKNNEHYRNSLLEEGLSDGSPKLIFDYFKFLQFLKIESFENASIGIIDEYQRCDVLGYLLSEGFVTKELLFGTTRNCADYFGIPLIQDKSTRSEIIY